MCAWMIILWLNLLNKTLHFKLLGIKVSKVDNSSAHVRCISRLNYPVWLNASQFEWDKKSYEPQHFACYWIDLQRCHGENLYIDKMFLIAFPRQWLWNAPSELSRIWTMMRIRSASAINRHFSLMNTRLK